MSNPTALRADDYLDSLTDEEVAAIASTSINDLCSKKRRWTMSIPPDRRDQDLIFSELVKRFLAIARREERLRLAIDEILGTVYDPNIDTYTDKSYSALHLKAIRIAQEARAALTPEEGQVAE